MLSVPLSLSLFFWFSGYCNLPEQCFSIVSTVLQQCRHGATFVPRETRDEVISDWQVISRNNEPLWSFTHVVLSIQSRNSIERPYHCSRFASRQRRRQRRRRRLLSRPHTYIDCCKLPECISRLCSANIPTASTKSLCPRTFDCTRVRRLSLNRVRKLA